MTSIRSSVRPKSSKQAWGTILKPEFGLGYQRMTEYEIEQTVNRLAVVPPAKQPYYHRPQKKISQEEVKAMMDRLTKADKRKIPESDRRVTVSDYSTMGVVCSYAWKGYN
ncbi:protein cepu-1 [Biomphalaria glabrata]|uniref:Uncharacterized protein LOC106080048 n=2 Tax=Biomphalaria TaxID=6525 RepID=A0A2C9KV31_BIOGL|nr:uncharacterized protein LOC106080048 [Biomphalaria glabrata]XP_013096791.1 uncharacterized protein LOC106080048 [Biomphalaria glabrata]XP_055875270.1 uncharacterized protein LOC106080048 [Biomphalaria glabrata]XP_055875271.1 uncharacterized protein LOC106080048 [Biomphalaria glabrata]KAK0049184.1 hypothetical protein Bpfe_021277 [Biomphalaria pfeifferi]KAI8766469.1 CAunnamed protein product [Biomphalaria glabrata]KAI8794294.1 CAunnamed protein product [Biomphalaria glabrata]